MKYYLLSGAARKAAADAVADRLLGETLPVDLTNGCWSIPAGRPVRTAHLAAIAASLISGEAIAPPDHDLWVDRLRAEVYAAAAQIAAAETVIAYLRRQGPAQPGQLVDAVVAAQIASPALADAVVADAVDALLTAGTIAPTGDLDEGWLDCAETA